MLLDPLASTKLQWCLALLQQECQRCRAYGSGIPTRQHPSVREISETGEPEPFAPGPAPDHQHRNDPEPGSKTGPDADPPPVHRESQRDADAKSDRPIADQGKDHWNAGIM